MTQEEKHLSGIRRLWLAADYHFPALYSCRLPMSSMATASITPAPGPATVRLALVKVALECFGYDEVREKLFPTIRSMSIRIRPPERVAISPHVLRAYKLEERRGNIQVNEAPILREMAHAEGPMTLYLHVPRKQEAQWRDLLHMIGYWGQTDSLAICLSIDRAGPDEDECGRPLQEVLSAHPLHAYFPCLLTEFRDHRVTWEEILPDAPRSRLSPLQYSIYVWPLKRIKQHAGGTLFVRTAFSKDVSKHNEGEREQK